MKRMLLLAAALALTTLACFEGEETTPPPKRLEPTSPANVLKSVAMAFNNRNADLLKAMLSEDFVFYFDPRDVGRYPPEELRYKIPGSRAEFLQAVENMFDEAHSINLSIPTSRVGTPAENETTYRADNISISLLVMVNEENGFIAEGGYCNFEFEKYTTKEGKKYWRLTGWWDRTSEGYDEYPGLTPTSLGKILAVYN